MTYEQKAIEFNKLSQRDIFRNKTDIDKLPLEFKVGSSEGAVSFYTTNNFKLWIRFVNDKWFSPYGNFSKDQIIKMIEICINDRQVISLFELLSATNE